MESRHAFIFSTISARLEADVHSLKGFITIITSASSTAIGSVGTSAVPILATTCLISGKRSFSFFSASSETSILLLSELPAGRVICIAKSPSSKVGINSAPSFVNSNSESNKATKDTEIVPHT
ncbi:unknown [Bacteroides sp. CAG:1076]|nr:unknown [Bacteroides sp. CAG:1076]